MDDFDYDKLLELAKQAPEANMVVCRSREEAEALVNWVAETFPEDANG